MIFIVPVSSSKDKKTTPFAVAGFCLNVTIPATLTWEFLFNFCIFIIKTVKQ